MSNNPQNVLLEVRKAYRLLYQYQRRILDLMKYIGNAYQCSYKGGYTKFSNVSPRNGTGKLTNWAWDWLSMYYYEFHFESNKCKFSVFLLNDTGYFEANKQESISPTSISKFFPIEKSETKLIFVAGKNLWEGWSNDWRDLYFVLEKQGLKTKGEGKMVFKSYDLEGFFEESNAEIQLKDFQAYCEENDIPIKFSPKKI